MIRDNYNLLHCDIIACVIQNYSNRLLYSVMYSINYIRGVMVSVIGSIAVDRGFQPRTGQTKDSEIGICCFSVKHVPLWCKIKDWLAHNQDNVHEWSDMSTRGLLYQRVSTKKDPPKRVELVQIEHHHHLIECNIFSL